MPEVELAAAFALYGLKQPDGKAFLLDVLEGKQKTTSGFMSSEKRAFGSNDAYSDHNLSRNGGQRIHVTRFGIGDENRLLDCPPTRLRWLQRR